MARTLACEVLETGAGLAGAGLGAADRGAGAGSGGGGGGATGWNAPETAPWLEQALNAASNAHFGAPLGEFLHHNAGIGLIDVNDDLFNRLQSFASRLIGAEHHAGPAYGQLEAFAPHGFNHT